MIDQTARGGTRLSATLDGKPVYLYLFVQGSYEDQRDLLYAHAEQLSRGEIIARVRAALKEQPEQISCDHTELDLLERALAATGFVPVNEEVPIGLWLPRVGVPTTRREYLEKGLDRLEREDSAGRDQGSEKRGRE